MITITKIEQQFKDGKPSGYKVNLSDGAWGYLVEKESDKGLKDGDVVTYTAETPTGKQYKKLTIRKEGQSSNSSSSPTPAPQPQAHAPKTINVAQMKFDARVAVFNAMTEGMFKGSFKADDEKTEGRIWLEHWVGVMDEMINDIFKG